MAKWENRNDGLEANFQFKNFQEALCFVNKVGKLAEIQDHHPDIQLHHYNKVHIRMTTHEFSNTISEKDIRLSQAISRLFP